MQSVILAPLKAIFNSWWESIHVYSCDSRTIARSHMPTAATNIPISNLRLWRRIWTSGIKLHHCKQQYPLIEPRSWSDLWRNANALYLTGQGLEHVRSSSETWLRVHIIKNQKKFGQASHWSIQIAGHKFEKKTHQWLTWCITTFFWRPKPIAHSLWLTKLPNMVSYWQHMNEDQYCVPQKLYGLLL